MMALSNARDIAAQPPLRIDILKLNIAARTAIDGQLSILAPEQDELILREACFSDPTLFYTGFTFHGRVAYA